MCSSLLNNVSSVVEKFISLVAIWERRENNKSSFIFHQITIQIFNDDLILVYDTFLIHLIVVLKFRQIHSSKKATK